MTQNSNDEITMETLENQITLETLDHLITNEYNNIKDESAEDVLIMMSYNR